MCINTNYDSQSPFSVYLTPSYNMIETANTVSQNQLPKKIGLPKPFEPEKNK